VRRVLRQRAADTDLASHSSFLRHAAPNQRWLFPLQKRQAEDARKREAELEVALEAERSSASQRETALVVANERLMARVEELSATVTALQAQVRA
jgi:hypothetical protein